MSMTIAELRSEIKARYTDAKAIEDRYPNGLTKDANHEDYEQVKKLLVELDTFEAQLLPLEEAEQRKARIVDNVTRYTAPASQHRHPEQGDPERWAWAAKTLGEQFTDSAEYKQMRDSGIFNSPSALVQFTVPMLDGPMINRKALVYSASAVGGALVAPDRRSGVLDILQRELTILDLIPRLSTQSDTIEYVREDTYTNSAAFTAAATATTGTSGTKPESTLAFSKQSATVRTLAHWIPVTNRMLADAPALRGIIDSRLLLGLDQTLETQCINGNGSGENFTGILGTAGINIQGVSGTGINNAADAIFAARTQIMVNGLSRPNAVVMHPNDWQVLRLARENAATGTLGGYVYGPPSVPGPMTIWGMPIVEALGAVDDTVLVGDFALGCSLFDREQGQVRVGTIDDQFVRNMQTILAEMRAAFVVWRPTAFAKVTGID